MPICFGLPFHRLCCRFYPIFAACCLSGAALPAAAAKAVAQPAAGAALAQSFSGAYLAGSYAADQGSPAAGSYFRRALSFRPGDKIARRELLLSLIENGDLAAAAPLAETMRQDADATVKPIVRLILAANAFKKQNYADVRAAIAEAGSKNESLLWVFLTSWADFGSGRKSRALHNLQQARLSEWYGFLCVYNTALMQDLSNNAKQAAAAYENALNYRQMAQIAPEAYEHLLRAYAGFTRRTDGKQAALKLLARGQAPLAAPSPLLAALKRDLEQGKTPPRLVKTPAEGAAEFAYDVGSAFLRAGEDLYADIYLQTALFLRPKDDSALFRLGILAAKDRQRQRAEVLFAQIPPGSPYFDDMEVLVALGISQNAAETGKPASGQSSAAAALEKMIARAPDKAALQNILANIYLQNGNYPAAIALLDSMLSKTAAPGKQEWSLYFQRGIAYERDKNWDKAEADFREALRLNPKNADILNYYGYSLADRGLKLETGLNMVRQAAELRPEDGAVADSLGWAYYQLGRYNEAVAALEKAVRLEPGESSINSHLGDAYWQIGRKRDAVFQWNHALAFKPDTEAEAAAIKEKLLRGLPDKQPAAAEAKAKNNMAAETP